MVKEQIIAFRNKAKAKNQQIFIYLDNSLMFYDGFRDMEYLIWDDANEQVFSFGPIRSYSSENAIYRRSETPYEKYVFTYDEIQGMGIYMDINGLKEQFEGMVEGGLITTEQANNMLVSMAPLSRANVSPIARTMKTYSDEDYKEYQESKKETETE